MKDQIFFEISEVRKKISTFQEWFEVLTIVSLIAFILLIFCRFVYLEKWNTVLLCFTFFSALVFFVCFFILIQLFLDSFWLEKYSVYFQEYLNGKKELRGKKEKQMIFVDRLANQILFSSPTAISKETAIVMHAEEIEILSKKLEDIRVRGHNIVFSFRPRLMKMLGKLPDSDKWTEV